MSPGPNHSQYLSDDEIIRLISEHLPGWKAACDNSEVDTVILQQKAFGSSRDELFLMSIAIKYAGIVNKTVMVAA